jgi:hypothetical protein
MLRACVRLCVGVVDVVVGVVVVVVVVVVVMVVDIVVVACGIRQWRHRCEGVVLSWVVLLLLLVWLLCTNSPGYSL